MSYGTPRHPDEIEGYYTDIRRGRPPTAAQLAELRRRYDAIGGLSPLAAIASAQADGVQAALEAIDPGCYVVALGTRHSRPSIEEAVGQLTEAGAGHIVGLVLAPHYSSLSVGAYAARAESEATRRGVALRTVESWHLDQVLIDLLSERVRSTIEEAAPVGHGEPVVVFTAHSLPAHILDTGDPYPRQVKETAEAVARRAGTGHWTMAWQSAGATGGEWLAPSLGDALVSLAEGGALSVVICPVGFTSDHLEVLYDIDIEAKALAARHGVRLARTPSLNDDPRFTAALARIVTSAPSETPAQPRAR